MPNHLDLIKPYFGVSFIIISSLIVQIFAPTSVELFRYQSIEVSQGEWWRIITANFTHSNWNHWMLNMVGLLLIDYLFQPLIKQFTRVLLVSFCIILNTVMLHIFLDIHWYVGISGALHGYLLGCALIAFKQAVWMNSAIIVVVTGKLIAELNWEINQATASYIEANVVEEAHLYGAISGLLFFILLFLTQEFINKKGH